MTQLPKEFIGQMEALLGGALPAFLRSYDAPPVRGVRMRPGQEKLPEAEEAVPWGSGAYYLPLSSRAGAAPEHEAGAYYIQEPSAMAPAAALHPQPGERVLDLCAAPGGKSTQLAAYLEGRGLLVCNEPVLSRAQVLSRNIERMGVPNAVVTCALPEELSPRWAGYFDKILVDAPCSGEGMFRRHPEARLEWSAAAPAGCAQRQGQILEEAAKMLRSGGRLCYSTCTFNALENEGVIQAFLFRHPEFFPVPFSLPGLPPCDGLLRLWPQEIRGEGHFAALLQKAEGPSAKPGPSPLSALPQQDRQIAEDFLREHIKAPVTVSGLFAGRAVSAPEELPPLQGIRVLRLGLQLGEIKGRLFFPDHALALACPAKRTRAVSREEARAYQAGQALPGPEAMRGYYVLTLNGLNLGWIKASGGQMKNHYPKGLRRPE